MADILAAFEGAYTHAGQSLGRFKRPEQALANKILVHAAAGILYIHVNLVTDFPQSHDNTALRIGRFLGVLQQVVEHGGEAFTVGFDLAVPCLERSQGNGQVVFARDDHFFKQGSHLHTFRPTCSNTGPHLFHQALHSSDGIGHGADHVIDKFGVVPVLCGV